MKLYTASLISVLVIVPVLAFKYYFNNNNPFPFAQEMIELQSRYATGKNNTTASNQTGSSSSSSSSNTNNSVATCVFDWLGDGNCNKENNNAACLYDKGDCCAETCKKNCYPNKCNYECGKLNRYNCTNGTAGCANCVNGNCIKMKDCMADLASVKKMVHIF